MTSQYDIFNTVRIKDGINFNTPGALNDSKWTGWEKGTFNVDYSGPFTAQTGKPVYFQRAGDYVTLTFKGVSTTAGAAAASLTATAIPTRLWPVNYAPVQILQTVSNGTNVIGTASLSTAGVLTVGAGVNNTSVFSASGGANGFSTFSIRYPIV